MEKEITTQFKATDEIFSLEDVREFLLGAKVDESEIERVMTANGWGDQYKEIPKEEFAHG